MKHSILYITTLFIFPFLSFFIISQVDKASAGDTVDLGSNTGLVKPKLEKSLYSHLASRLDISIKMGSLKLSSCMIDWWPHDSLFSKNERFFLLFVDNLVNKNAITSYLRKELSNGVGRTKNSLYKKSYKK